MQALGFYVWRRKGGRLDFPFKSRPPKFRHDTLEQATAEAARLGEMYPHSRFVVMAALSEFGPEVASEPAQEAEAA